LDSSGPKLTMSAVLPNRLGNRLRRVIGSATKDIIAERARGLGCPFPLD
jgi:hypothetical protein